MSTVADVMSRRVATIREEATLTEALASMHERQISSLLVIPTSGSGDHGTVTMGDVVNEAVRNSLDTRMLRVRDIVHRGLVSAQPTWTLMHAASAMVQHDVRRLPVMQRGEMIGLVSDTDLFTSSVPEQDWRHARAVRRERALQRGEKADLARAVGEIMSSPVLATSPGVAVQEAVKKMVASGIHSLLVVHSADTVQGIITKWDVIAKVLATGRSTHATTVGDVLSSPVRTIEAETSIEACSVRMADEKIRRFPVTRGGQIVGIISRKDTLAAVGARHFRALRPRQGPTSLLVADVMGPSSGTADPGVGEALSLELSLWEAADRLRCAGVPRLPVVQAGKVIGVVTEGDILRGLEERGAGD